MQNLRLLFETEEKIKDIYLFCIDSKVDIFEVVQHVGQDTGVYLYGEEGKDIHGAVISQYIPKNGIAKSWCGCDIGNDCEHTCVIVYLYAQSREVETDFTNRSIGKGRRFAILEKRMNKNLDKKIVKSFEDLGLKLVHKEK